MSISDFVSMETIILSHAVEMRPGFSSTSYNCHKHILRCANDNRNMYWIKKSLISKLVMESFLHFPYGADEISPKY